MTITITMCKEHTPNISAISEIGDEQFTFCENCESNIERFYDYGDIEVLPMWTDWYVSK